MPELTKVQTGFLEGQGQFELDPGTEAAPGVTFGDSSTGLYKSATDEVAVSISGTQKVKFTSTGVTGNLTGNVTGNLTGNVTGESIIQNISSEIADTAVDIFIYDTSKDSDGGAWRKRTSHTSWYNETLNTTTRGGRREFPAVAVIVAEINKVTIYDGDDPDMPMWMVFEVGRTPTVRMLNWYTGGTATISSVAQLNGRLCVGTAGGVTQFDFVEDAMYISYNLSVAYTPINNRISFRNDSNASNSGSSSEYFYFILSPTVNDVAMTVLPNAPIDSTTGLPIPTIAVATNGGVSVIKDDGSVVDITETTGPNSVREVTFRKSDGKLGFRYSDTAGNADYLHVGYCPIPSSDKSNSYFYGFSQSTFPGWEDHSYNQGGPDFSDAYPSIMPTGSFLGDGTALIDNNVGTNLGLVRINENPTSPANGMGAYITSDYNTGWQHGKIKGAFLSDTDATNVTGTELVSNYNFTSGTTNWTINLNGGVGGASITASSNQLVFTQGTNSVWLEAYQDIATVSGENYVIDFEVASSNTDANWRVFVAGTKVIGYPTLLGQGHHSYTFTASSTTTRVSIQQGGGGGTSGTVESLSVRIAEEDRSVNNKGLQVFGTITKSAVATGAELVAYSGFSIPNDVASTITNGLIQPYNTSLSGTTFVFSGWFKTSDSPDYQYTIQISDTTGTSHSIGGLSIYTNNSGGNSGLPYMWSHTGGNGASAVFSGSRVDDNVWHHFVAIYNTNSKTLYVDGVSRGTQAANTISSFSGAEVYIGMHRQVYSGGDYNYRHAMRGSLALIRVGTTIPSAEQIKKIYEDEKVLFQENAACTLYGSSDAVTALAYDEVTERLHVGTSSGRSEFQGLRRINNTTTAVTTAISAYDSFVVEQ